LQELRKLLAFLAIAGASALALWVLWPRPSVPRGLPSVPRALPAPSPSPSPAEVDGGFAQRTIQGRVSDGAGRAVAGARIDVLGQARSDVEASGELGILRGPIPYPPAQPLFAGAGAVSDADGNFRLQVPPGRLWLSASHPQFARKTVEASTDRVELVLEPAAVAAGEPLPSPLEAGDQRLAGLVVDDRGFPIAGARVEAAGRVALSDGGGRFALTGLPAGPYQVRASRTDFAPTEMAGVTAGDEARLQLLPGGGIEGQLDDSRGARLPEATVLELGVDGHAQRVLVREGRFEVTGIRAGRVTLSARAPGYVPLHHTLEVPAGDRPRDFTVRDLRLTLERAGIISGSVRGDDGPLAGAQISAGAANCRTDGRGEFRLEGVAPGRVPLLVNGRRADEVEVRADEESRVDLTIP
jgi:hypothetical protein